MLDQLIYLFITAILTFALYPLWINFVYKYHMGEEIRSDGPKTHVVKKGTPTMGGLVFIFTVAIVTFIFNRSRTQTLFPIFVASMAGLFGLMEDFSKVYKNSSLGEVFRFSRGKVKNTLVKKIFRFFLTPWRLFKEYADVVGSAKGRGLQTYQKFIIQSVIGGFVSYWTFFKLGWDYIWFPLIGNVHIGYLYPVFIFIVFIVLLNFIAFTDGIDGLAGGLATISLMGFWILAGLLGFNSLATLCATFIGALLPFLYFNVHPARIFMGDVGSHVLGATLIILAVVMHREIALLFICGVFIVDGASSPIQQLSVKLTGKRVFRMAPIHHHFELLGWPETKVTMRFWLIGIALTLFGVFVSLL